MRIEKLDNTGPCDVVVNSSGPKRCGVQTPYMTELEGQNFRICMPHIEDQRAADNKRKV